MAVDAEEMRYRLRRGDTEWAVATVVLEKSEAIAVLLDCLKDQEVKVRQNTAAIIRRFANTPAVLDNPSTIPALAIAMHDCDALVRKDATEAVGVMVTGARNREEKCAASVPLLLYGIGTDDPFLRSKGSELLARVAAITEVSLRQVQKSLQERVERTRKTGNKTAIRIAMREAARDYTLISRAVGTRLAEKHSSMEGILLEGERPRAPSRDKMYRAACERSALA